MATFMFTTFRLFFIQDRAGGGDNPGFYIGVDLALVTDVLPNPDNAAKDLGVFNIANALPQSIAPALGAFLLRIGSVDNQNYDLLLITAGVLGFIGAVAVISIKPGVA